MGQYFYIVNVDKKEWFQNDFVKMMEFSIQNNPACCFLLKLLANEWKGDRVIIAGDYSEYIPEDMKEEVSKYLDDNWTQGERLNRYYDRKPDSLGLYDYASSVYKEVYYSEYSLTRLKRMNQYKRLPWELTDADWNTKYRPIMRRTYRNKCILFEDFHTFIDLDKYYNKEIKRRAEAGNKNSWVECPYTILLATNDSGGGGDYSGYNSEEVIGMFLGSRVSVHPRGAEELEGMNDLTNDLIIDESFEPEPSFEAEGGIEGNVEGMVA